MLYISTFDTISYLTYLDRRINNMSAVSIIFGDNALNLKEWTESFIFRCYWRRLIDQFNLYLAHALSQTPWLFPIVVVSMNCHIGAAAFLWSFGGDIQVITWAGYAILWVPPIVGFTQISITSLDQYWAVYVVRSFQYWLSILSQHRHAHRVETGPILARFWINIDTNLGPILAHFWINIISTLALTSDLIRLLEMVLVSLCFGQCSLQPSSGAGIPAKSCMFYIKWWEWLKQVLNTVACQSQIYIFKIFCRLCYFVYIR